MRFSWWPAGSGISGLDLPPPFSSPPSSARLCHTNRPRPSPQAEVCRLVQAEFPAVCVPMDGYHLYRFGPPPLRSAAGGYYRWGNLPRHTSHWKPWGPTGREGFLASRSSILPMCGVSFKKCSKVALLRGGLEDVSHLKKYARWNGSPCPRNMM